MMRTFITQGGEGRGEEIRRGKLRKAKAEALKRGLVARSCARSGRKDVVGKVKGKANIYRLLEFIRCCYV